MQEKKTTMDHHDVVLITTAQLYSVKPERRFSSVSNPAYSVS